MVMAMYFLYVSKLIFPEFSFHVVLNVWIKFLVLDSKRAPGIINPMKLMKARIIAVLEVYHYINPRFKSAGKICPLKQWMLRFNPTKVPMF